MTKRQTAADYEREAQRLAANAADPLYSGAPARDRAAVLSGTYATLALMATIREGREPVVGLPEEAPEPLTGATPLTVDTPQGRIILYPIPRGGSQAPHLACVLRQKHPAHLWLRAVAGGTAAVQCEGREKDGL